VHLRHHSSLGTSMKSFHFPAVFSFGTFSFHFLSFSSADSHVFISGISPFISRLCRLTCISFWVILFPTSLPPNGYTSLSFLTAFRSSFLCISHFSSFSTVSLFLFVRPTPLGTRLISLSQIFTLPVSFSAFYVILCSLYRLLPFSFRSSGIL